MIRNLLIAFAIIWMVAAAALFVSQGVARWAQAMSVAVQR